MAESKKADDGFEVEITPPKMGRPTSYDPDYCDRVKELGAKGYSRAQIAADIGVARQTLYDWEQAHPEFLDSMRRAKDLELAWWEHAGQRGMFMKSFSAAAWGLQARNRFPREYRDQREIDHSGGVVVKVLKFSDAGNHSPE